ncbi:MAG: cytochrome c [Candidatus Omnitrophota bacterium]
MIRKGIVAIVFLLALLALTPILMMTMARMVKSDTPRFHLIQDMDNQPKFHTQSANPFFVDQRSMRPQVTGTVERERKVNDDHFNLGKINNEWANTFPLPLTKEFVQRGQNRFAIHCAPCHGQAGYGDGIIHKRAEKLNEGTWVQPTSYHSDELRKQPVGQIFHTITNGIRNMAAYGHQISTEDRWAITAYVKALQRSQNARIEDVPEELRGDLK